LVTALHDEYSVPTGIEAKSVRINYAKEKQPCHFLLKQPKAI